MTILEKCKIKLSRQLDPATSKTSAISTPPLCSPPPGKVHRSLTFKYVLVNFDKLLRRLQEILHICPYKATQQLQYPAAATPKQGLQVL